MIEENDRIIHIFKKELADGGFAIAAFNLGKSAESVTVSLDEMCTVRDVWAKKNLPSADTLNLVLHPHTVRVYRMLRHKPAEERPFELFKREFSIN